MPMGKIDLLGAIPYWSDVCPGVAVVVCNASPNGGQASAGSVRALPASRLCTTSSYCTGPHATYGVYIYLVTSPGQWGYLGHTVHGCIGSGIN